MKRTFTWLALLVGVGVAAAQGDIRRGTVKKLDVGAKTITLTVGEKDFDYHLTEQTRVFGAEDKPFKERFAGIKPGTAVMFKTASRGGKEVVVGLKAAGTAANPKQKPAQPAADTSKLKPLTVLGTGKYEGYEGGLYPDGENARPKEHDAFGLALAKQIRPLGPDGKPDPAGKAVLLSVGMSNTTQEFSTFQKVAAGETGLNPALVLVDGAQGGMTAARIKDPEDNASGAKYWSVVDQRLKAAGVTREQVEVAWVKEADAGPTEGFPKYARTLRDELRQLVRAMHRRFPNLKIAYLSSRTYGGYARTALNPEPYAYESGFSVKWLIEEQVKGSKGLNFDRARGSVEAPWLAWGPYLWANGTAKNPDGLWYEESDFGPDGTHPSASGRRKVAEQLLKFFKTDATAKPWFLKGGGLGGAPRNSNRPGEPPVPTGGFGPNPPVGTGGSPQG